MKSVVLVSGGLDSTTLLHWVVKAAKDDVHALTVSYGQRHIKEIECAEYQCDLLNVPYSVLDLSFLSKFLNSSSLIASSGIEVPHVQEVMGDPQPSTYVPNRNMIFLSIAAAFAENIEASFLYYGAQVHDIYGYWDTTRSFLNKINEVFELNRKAKLKIQAPFINLRKSDIIKLGVYDLDIDYSQTWSCYNGTDLACGVCGTCAERIQGFKELGLTDPIRYKEIK